MKIKIIYFALLFISVMLISVSILYERYKILEIEGFQKYIAEQKIFSDQEIIEAFFEYQEYDYIPRFKLLDKGNDDRSEIEIIYSVRDDSIKSEKLVFIIDGSTKNIIEIRESWKCRPGRGHWYWGTGSCY